MPLRQPPGAQRKGAGVRLTDWLCEHRRNTETHLNGEYKQSGQLQASYLSHRYNFEAGKNR